MDDATRELCERDELAECRAELAAAKAERDAAVRRAVLADNTARVACERFAAIKAAHDALIDQQVENARLTAELAELKRTPPETT